MGIYGQFAKRLCESNLNLLNQPVILSEDCIGANNNMSVYVYKQDTRMLNGNPENAYMEVYNNKNMTKATKMIRLVIGKPYYRDHTGQKPLWNMKSADIKSLNKLMNSASNNKKYQGKTVFQAALDFYQIDPNLPVTDYTNMKPEPSSNQKKKDSKKKK